MTIDAPSDAAAPVGIPQLRLVRTLGRLCVATALMASIFLGTWELAHPVFGGGAGRYTLTPASAVQLWAYGILQALKPLGFLAGLFGIYFGGTRRNIVLKGVLGLAAAGGVFYAIVWIMIAVTGRDDAVYLAGRAIGSDARTNGGVFFLWLAPIVLGVGALLARRIPRWQAVWLMGTGFLGSRLFGALPVGVALVVEGILWFTVGMIAVSAERGA